MTRWPARRVSAGRRIGRALLGVVLLPPMAWAGLALWFQCPGGAVSKLLAIVAWAAFDLSVLASVWRGRSALAIAAFAAVVGGLLLWWNGLAPTNDRAWAADVARISHARVDGSIVTFDNVRNFDWRSDSDFTERWETRRYDLDRLASVDMIMSYWSGKAIAHMLVSFGFDDGQQLAFSVEVRRGRQQSFSEVGGFFKAFELSVIAADERDVVRVRTNVRGEDDYLYRVDLPKADMRALFLAYVDEANSLVQTPRFYNTITVNCTTLVYHMMTRIVGHVPLDYRLLLTGYLPSFVYSLGGLDARHPLDELTAAGRITDRARAADEATDFSAQIRRGIPDLVAH